jgi:hypothetical protein
MNADATARKPLGITATVLISLFGIALPLVTLAIEAFSHWCASILFDPIPTIFHALLVALVPIASLVIVIALLKRKSEQLTWLGWLSGISIGAAAYYALLFIPFSPFAVIGIMFFGAGLLPLSPILALICAIILCFRLRRLAPVEGTRPPGLWIGIIAVFIAIAAIEAPKVITLTGLQMTASENADDKARGVRLLRQFGSRDTILQTCYSRNALIGDPMSFLFGAIGNQISASVAREAYYRVTGTPFNAVKPPHFRRFRNGWDPDSWDYALGTDEVEARVRGLSLQESRFDANVDPDAGTAYSEWILAFHNTSTMQQEARSQVLLPPGSAVSRLTLWIDGEEREAAFGGRSQVKEAYQKVVQRRRDPVLVTTSGPDQVLVQCFPVPPNGGFMKIRIGITSPISLEDRRSGALRLPYFVERNFSVPNDLHGSVWIESRRGLSSAAPMQDIVAEPVDGKGNALRGVLQGAALDSAVTVRAERDEQQRECWAPDKRSQEPGIVRQVIREQPLAPPGRLVVVVDGSRRMRDYRDDIAGLLCREIAGMEFAVVLASDETVELVAPASATPETCATAAEKIKNATFQGGCDNVPALSKAWDIAAAKPSGVILWLHATQPVELSGLEALLQKWDRRPDGPRLISMQCGSGPDRVMKALAGRPMVSRGERTADPIADARRLAAVWGGRAPNLGYERVREPATATPACAEASSHLVRLWALDEVTRLVSMRKDADRSAAVRLAHDYQLVTQVSGAVVLETKQQFEEAGLDPAATDTVPTIPEPGTWLLMALGSLLLMARARWYGHLSPDR